MRHNDGTGAFKAQIAGSGEMVWSENALSFDTEAEAKDYASDLLSRWMGADMARVVPTATPTRAPVDLADPAIVLNYRTGMLTEITNDDIIEAEAILEQHHADVTCPACKGSGVHPWESSKNCPKCKGSGIKRQVQKRFEKDVGKDILSSRHIAVQWMDSEWTEGGFAAYEGGVDANVYPSDDEDAKPGEWTWDVKATAEVSEWPGLFDMGWEATEAAAKAAAEKSLVRAVESYKGSTGVDKFSASRTEAAQPSGVSDHDAEPEWDTATAYDSCKTCGWPVKKGPQGWGHEQKNPAQWSDKRTSSVTVSCRKCAGGHTPDGEDCGYCDGLGSLDHTTAMVKAADGWEQGITAEAFTTAVNTDAQGTDRYQKTKHPSQVPWADADDWDHGQATQEELDTGRQNSRGHVGERKVADVSSVRRQLKQLVGYEVKMTYTDSWGVGGTMGVLSMADGNAAVTSKAGSVVSVPDHNVLSVEATGNFPGDPWDGAGYKEPTTMDMIMSPWPSGAMGNKREPSVVEMLRTANPYSDQNPYTSEGPGAPDSGVSTPQTTRPRVMPNGGDKPDPGMNPENFPTIPNRGAPRLGPVDRDADSTVIPAKDSLRQARNQYTRPPSLSPRAAKIATIAAGVGASNPGMNHDACIKVAEATLQRFNGVVRS